MPQSIPSPKLTIKDLIKNNWDNTNTLTITPDFHTGWLNPGGAQYQVVFPTVTEGTPTPSGYGPMAADGPVSWRIGTLPIGVFGRRDPVEATPVNPKKWVELAAREIERIIHANFISIADFEYLSVSASDEQPPDTQTEPPYYGWTVMAQYEWRKTLT